MAQAVQSAIVDLTGEDDHDDSIARAHVACENACEKAFAAASRLTCHFELWKQPTPTFYQGPKDNVNLTEGSSISTTIPEMGMVPQAGTITGPVRSEIDGLRKIEKNHALIQQNPSISSPGISTLQPPISTTAPKLAMSPSMVERMGVKKQGPREKKPVTPKSDNFHARRPRSAAISAKQSIAEACNELEKWVNKDPSLIPQKAGVSTLKRPARTDDDLDEWSPSSDVNNKDERKELGRISTKSPTPSAVKYEGLNANKDNDLSYSHGMSTAQGTKKRKLSELSQSSDSIIKVARQNEEPSAQRDSNPPVSVGVVDRKHGQDRNVKNPFAGIYPKCIYPAIKAAKAKYEKSLTEDELACIAKSVTNSIMEQGADAFCPASANCPKKQRAELIMRSVSEAFHEKALRVKSGCPINSIASAEDTSEGLSAPIRDSGLRASRPERNAPSEATVKMNGKSPSTPPRADSAKNGASVRSEIRHIQEKIDPRLLQGFHQASDPTESESRSYPASLVPGKYAVLYKSVVCPALKKSKKRNIGSVPQEDLDTIGNTVVNEVMKRLASQPEGSDQLDTDTKKKIKRFVKKSFRQKVRKYNTQASHNPAAPPTASNPYISSPSPGIDRVAGDKQSLTGRHHPTTPARDHSENVALNRANVENAREPQTPQQPNPDLLDQQLPLSPHVSSNESPTSSFAPDFDRGRYPALRRRRGNKYYTPTRTALTTAKFGKGQSMHTTDRIFTEPAPTNLGPRETQLTASANDGVWQRTSPNEGPALDPLTSIEGPTNTGQVSSEPASYADVAKALRDFSSHARGKMIDSHTTTSQKNTATNQLAQSIRGRRSLDGISPLRELRPNLRPKPATALDPSLEHVVAVLVTDTSSGPYQESEKYSVNSTDQVQLVTDRSIVKHVDRSSKTGKSKLVRIETKVVDPVRQTRRHISSLLRNRELGLTTHGRHVGTVGELHQVRSEMIEPWKNWKGASGDVVAVAWNPDSNVFAFGAAAHTNVEDIQYNRPCNLLLGDLTSNQIRELPDHRIDRPKPETIPNGPNASQAVYDACDPKVYETVSSIAFSPTGDRMLTASHDCTVKIWNVSAGKHQRLSTLHHDAWVTSIEISEHRPGLFATASKCVKDAVRIYHDLSCVATFSASRAEMRPEWKIYPECLRWGPNPSTSHLLLAGFQQWEQQGDLLSGGGQLCLWDARAFESIKVTPSSQSVYAAAWHPTQSFFATGGAPGNNISDKFNTKTVVRTWDIRTPKRCQVEYECPATDMQDITFSPLDPNIVTAGCTDGSSYVWDWRWPDQLLHHLQHGRPLAELDHTREREEADTGVMLSLWGPGGSLFYTGSSDGMIKAWDVRRHPNDVLIRNVANYDVSIQSGAFSPDGNNLLVGDAEGGIHVLSSAPCGPRSNVKSTDAYIELVRASDGSGAKLDESDDNPGTEGIDAARSLVGSGQLDYHKELGVGQGHNYQGPYATYARKETEESGVGRLRKKYEKKQPISKRGEKRWDIAIPMTSLLYERKLTLDREKDSNQMALVGLGECQPKATTQRSDGEEVPQSNRLFTTIDGAGPAAKESNGATVAGGREDGKAECDVIPEDEMVEENFWWVRMGEDEIALAKAGRVKG